MHMKNFVIKTDLFTSTYSTLKFFLIFLRFKRSRIQIESHQYNFFKVQFKTKFGKTCTYFNLKEMHFICLFPIVSAHCIGIGHFKLKVFPIWNWCQSLVQ